MKNGLTNSDFIRIDNELNDIVMSISRYYNIPVDELHTIMENIDTKCNANVWNLGNPVRCSRNKMNNCYCSIHQNQINKYGKIRLGNYNNQDNFNDIDNTINKEDYLELECDLVEYNEKYYYINQQNIYTLIDREQNIVDVLTDDNIKKQLLIEYNKLS